MSDRILGALVIVAVCGVVGFLVYRAYFLGSNPVEDIMVTPEISHDKPAPAVRTRVIDCMRVGRNTRVRANLVNSGNVPISAVTVQSIWKDQYGTVLDTGLVYAVGDDNPLLPGDVRSFSDTTALRNVARCNVRALDWWSNESN